MKIVIEKNNLFDGLQRVFSVVPQKPTLPVLTNFLVRAFEGRLSISGTDMDISISTSIDCSVEREGTITVNAKRFLNIVRELPEGVVDIDVEEERVNIFFSNGKSSLMGMASTDFPAIREQIDGSSLSLSGNDLVEMVERAGFSVATDRTRIALTGVYMKITGDEITTVSTDGHRLSLLRKKTSVDIDGEAEAIIPLKTLNQAAKIFSSGIELQKIVFGDGVILCDFGMTKIFSKLIEGPYPNFSQVIPVNNTKKVYASSEELEAAIRRVSVLSNTITHQIRFSLSAGQLDLSTSNSDIGGESQEKLPVRFEGESMTAGYNAQFFMELLRKVKSDEVLLDMESPTVACLIKPVEEDESEECIYLIMPLRLND